MRRVVLLAVLATLLAATPAAAHQFPAGCLVNGTSVVLGQNLTAARPGDAQSYSITASNDAQQACDVSNASVVMHLPGLTGAPSVLGTPIVTGQPLPAGTPPTPVADVPWTVAVNPGVTAAMAQIVATGTLHDTPADSQASVTRSIGTVVTQPGLSLAFTATPSTGFAPLNFTYEYVVTNTSSTPVPMSSVAITVPAGGCTPITRVGGDTNGNNKLDNGEAWRFTCPGSLPLPGTLTTGAVATAVSDVDTFPVSTGESKVTVTAQAPPRPVLTLTRGATPNGPAPLTVTYSYAVRNDSVPDARPVKDVFIDDPVCPGATRTSAPDALLQRGETWTYSCTRVLATPGTVSGTAIAKGKDDLLNADAWSDAVGLEVTATATAPAPTPTPTPTPEEPTADPTPTPRPQTPSARVNLATTRGTLTRCTTRSATAQLKVGKRVIATKRFRLDSRCRYTVRFTGVTRSTLRSATRVTVTVKAGKKTKTHRLTVPKR